MSEGLWYGIRDGDPRARALLNRHYSARRYKDGRRPLKIIGPGEYMLLMTQDSRAVFSWRKSKVRRLDNQVGIYCSLFRNEGSSLSSDLIREADVLAWKRWPDKRHFTYVDRRAVKSSNAGYCYLAAGWRQAGWSGKGLLLLEIER